MFFVHWQTFNKGVETWASIRKNRRLVPMSEAEALENANRLMSDGASYVEIVQDSPRRIAHQFGTVPNGNYVT